VDQEQTKIGGKDPVCKAEDRQKDELRQGRGRSVVWTGAEHTNGVAAGAARRHKAARSGMTGKRRVGERIRRRNGEGWQKFTIGFVTGEVPHGGVGRHEVT